MGVRHRSGSQAARRPVILEASVEVAAAEGDDGVGAANRPEHAGPFETGTDYGLTTGFDDARADEQMPAAEFWRLHAPGVSLEVIGFQSNLLNHCGMGGVERANGGHQLLDFAFASLGLFLHHRHAGAVHLQIQNRNRLADDDGHVQLHGLADFALLGGGDIGANGFGRPLYGFGGDFQASE